jgi:tetratricopeptide (TPR) repeat protein
MASASALSHRLREAIALHQGGQLPLAEFLYRGVLAEAPEHAQALGLLGLVEAAKRNVDSAIGLLRRSLQIEPNDAANQFNLGLLLQERKLDEQALECFSRAAELSPDTAAAHHGRGLALKNLGRYDEAVASYDRALCLAPGHAEGWNNHGVALQYLQRHEQAVTSFSKAIALRAALPQLRLNLGRSLHALGRHEEALAAFETALKLSPNSSDAAMNCGVELYELRRFDHALAMLRRAAALDPSNLDVHLNLGNVLLELNRHDEAISSIQKVIDERGGDVHALMNMANVLRDLHRYEEALPFYEQALAVRPRDVEVSWNRALCLLAMGDFERGWPGFEWRRQSASMSDLARVFTAPPWTGEEAIVGKTILLHAEQGLGDTIQFCRFATEISRMGAHVVLEAQRPLVRLLRSLEGVSQVLAGGEDLPDCDFQLPLMSAPAVLGTRLDALPAHAAYLRADPVQVERWRPQIEAKRGFRIGLVWSGNTAFPNNHRRLVPLASLLEALPDGLQCWSLQKDVSAPDAELIDRSPLISTFENNDFDFEHTAAQIQLLDAVITVDTSVAHVSAALGKPTWLLVQWKADWRWMWGRADNPWYPSMRLFRQEAPGDWDSALQALARHLAAAMALRRP